MNDQREIPSIGVEDAYVHGAEGGALASYVAAVRAHPFVIVAAIIAALAGSALFVLRARTYEATAEILVSPISPSDRSFIGLPLPRAVGDPARAVDTAAGIVDSPAAASLTAQRLGGGQTANGVRSAVSVEPGDGSNIVDVVAEASNRATAAEIANGYVRAALDVRQSELRPVVRQALAVTERELSRLGDPTSDTAAVLRTRAADLRSIRNGADPTLSVVQEAAPPSAPAGLPRWLVLASALVAGTTIGLVASLLIELLVPRRVKSQADVLRVYPLPVLARVPALRSANSSASDLVNEPPLPVANAFRALRTQLEIRPGPRPAAGVAESSVVVVTSSSRGDGRTTTAIGLARALTRRQRAALVIDLDFRDPSVATLLGLEPAHDLASLLTGQMALQEVFTPVPGNPRLAILAAPPDADPSMADRLSLMVPDLLSEARSWAEWVVVDAPPLSHASDVLSIGDRCDHLVMVSRIGHTDEGALAASRDLLEPLSLMPTGHLLVGVGRVDVARSTGVAGILRPAAGRRRATSR